MAQGAIILLLFAFMMCLSCLSSSAVGTGVFYACSDGTMSPGDFDFSKCTNFGLSDVVSGTEAITGLDVGSDDPEPTTTSSPESLTLVPTGPVEEEDPNATYLDFFGAGSTGRLSGLGVVAGATSKTECAKICYNNEVPMRGEGEECNGFVSDGFSKCILYPTPDTIAGVSLPTGEKSYGLKATRNGQTFNTFSSQNFETAYSTKGGPKQYGNNHDVECVSGNKKGALTSFRWQNSGNNTRNLYSCLMGDFGGIESEQSTPQDLSGSTHKCSKDRNEFGYLARNNIGLVDCGDQFIHRWKLNQQSNSMNISFNCTRDETSDSSACVDLETDGSYGRGCNTGELLNTNVACPNNMALTRFNWSNGKIQYRCCPKPAASAVARTRTRSNTQLAEAAAAAQTANLCQPKNLRSDCYEVDCNQYTTSGSCEDAGIGFSNGIKCCNWTG